MQKFVSYVLLNCSNVCVCMIVLQQRQHWRQTQTRKHIVRQTDCVSVCVCIARKRDGGAINTNIAGHFHTTLFSKTLLDKSKNFCYHTYLLHLSQKMLFLYQTSNFNLTNYKNFFNSLTSNQVKKILCNLKWKILDSLL